MAKPRISGSTLPMADFIIKDGAEKNCLTRKFMAKSHVTNGFGNIWSCFQVFCFTLISVSRCGMLRFSRISIVFGPCKPFNFRIRKVVRNSQVNLAGTIQPHPALQEIGVLLPISVDDVGITSFSSVRMVGWFLTPSADNHLLPTRWSGRFAIGSA